MFSNHSEKSKKDVITALKLSGPNENQHFGLVVLLKLFCALRMRASLVVSTENGTTVCSQKTCPRSHLSNPPAAGGDMTSVGLLRKLRKT